ncbi:MAG: alanine racemase [Clostridia bacterium]|nr:alanine racemase [Clostridia bacterium]
MEEARAKARAWLEVDEDALLKNYRLAKSLCRKETKLICVAKANAYGMGLRRTVETLAGAGADWFSVAAPEEALLARRAAPRAGILLMGPADESYLPALIQNDIALTIGSFEDGLRASRAALQAGKPARAHIKLDTGLHRLGFTDAKEALRLKTLQKLAFDGVYSHLALRSEAQSREQYAAFLSVTEEMAAAGLRPPMRHLLDSIGLTCYPEWQLDAVRIGAFLYGNAPVSWARFSEGENVATFKARVTRVAWVKAGEGVGYDETPLARNTRVATLSAGYIDGYSRALSQKGFVLVREKKAPVLGLVCMDQMMIDVTDIPDARPGDEATLLGGGVDLREYAALGHLNRNECLGVIGRRVPRIYCRAGKTVHIEAEMDAEKS